LGNNLVSCIAGTEFGSAGAGDWATANTEKAAIRKTIRKCGFVIFNWHLAGILVADIIN
jgi:hypothetical protein